MLFKIMTRTKMDDYKWLHAGDYSSGYDDYRLTTSGKKFVSKIGDTVLISGIKSKRVDKVKTVIGYTIVLNNVSFDTAKKMVLDENLGEKLDEILKLENCNNSQAELLVAEKWYKIDDMLKEYGEDDFTIENRIWTEMSLWGEIKEVQKYLNKLNLPKNTLIQYGDNDHMFKVKKGLFS